MKFFIDSQDKNSQIHPILTSLNIPVVGKDIMRPFCFMKFFQYSTSCVFIRNIALETGLRYSYIPIFSLRDNPTRFFDTLFFVKRLILVPIYMPKSAFECCRIFVELLIFEKPKSNLPLSVTAGRLKRALENLYFFILYLVLDEQCSTSRVDFLLDVPLESFKCFNIKDSTL